MEQIASNSPTTSSPIVQEIILSNRVGAIAELLSEKLGIEPLRALKLFYESDTCCRLHDRDSGLYLYSDPYVADEFMLEMQYKFQ